MIQYPLIAMAKAYIHMYYRDTVDNDLFNFCNNDPRAAISPLISSKYYPIAEKNW